MASDQSFFDRGKALEYVKKVLSAAGEVRIATAFFELSGYELIADLLFDRSWKLLLGNEEGTEDKIRIFLDTFLDSIKNIEVGRRVDLLKRFRAALKNGSLQFRVGKPGSRENLQAKYLAHHAKLYIAGMESCLVTSANFTRNGLLVSREAGHIVTDTNEVAFFVEKFDEHFSQASPLTKDFLETIDSYLEFRSPYEVYARALLELYGLPEALPAGPLVPLAAFQRPIVSGVLQSLRDFGGAMLIASTGLGKTIMASHVASILRNSGEIYRVLVIAPAGLRDMWSNSMRSGSVSSAEFSYSILSLDDWKKFRNVARMDEELQNINDKTLLILDESHHLRNAHDQANKKEMRLRNKRIKKAASSGAKVLLLTATPYSKSLDDINNQLELLPKVQDPAAGSFFPLSWSVQSTREISRLEVASVMTAPTVVGNYAQTDAQGNKYVVYRETEKRYFPSKVQLRTIEYENRDNPCLLALLNSGLLHVAKDDGNNTLFNDEDDTFPGKRDGLYEARLVHQFCSSPAEVDAILNKLEKDKGYKKMQFARQAELTGLVKGMIKERQTEFRDGKYDSLHRILSDHPNQKIVIFCIYHETAKYLLKKLRQDLPDRRSETTANKDPDQLETVLDCFAPVANGKISPDAISDPDNEYASSLLEKSIDILIATEAISEGFNLQDAALLVNYDLPWTVLALAQRMGRILRPWHEPRNITIWNFVPDTMLQQDFHMAMSWHRRLHFRSKEYADFSQLPVLTRDTNSDIQLCDIADLLHDQQEQDLSLEETMNFITESEQIRTTTVFDDLAIIPPDEAARINRIPRGFKSTRRNEGSESGFFILIRHNSRIFVGWYDSSGTPLLPCNRQQEILSRIRCTKDTMDTWDGVDRATYEELEVRCFQSLVRSLQLKEDDCAIICSIWISDLTNQSSAI